MIERQYAIILLRYVRANVNRRMSYEEHHLSGKLLLVWFLEFRRNNVKEGKGKLDSLLTTKERSLEITELASPRQLNGALSSNAIFSDTLPLLNTGQVVTTGNRPLVPP